MPFKATRLFERPIIVPHMDKRMGDNINGPSLIRVPSWISKPLGKYYLYFAHHKGAYIRMAYADELCGPWQTYEPGALALAQTHFVGHIASPDVHVDEDNQRIIMYFHGLTAPQDLPQVKSVLEAAGYSLPIRQNTRVAVSHNGIDFEVLPQIEPPLYLRQFRWNESTFGLAMPGFFFRSQDGLANFDPGPRLFTDAMRHCAVFVRDDVLHVFYTNAGDCPERILHASIQLTEDWNEWRTSEPKVLLEPEKEYEGSMLPLEPSKRGVARTPARQLRDPAIYEENGQIYLLYSVAGESGIAIAELHES